MHILILFLLLELTACAPINAEFSCKKTANDSCMTIDEAYQMSEKEHIRA